MAYNVQDQTPQKGYLIDYNNPGSRITFPYFPIHVEETKNANYAEVAVLGRSEPIFAYSSSSAKHIQVEFFFFAQTSVQAEVIPNVNFIRQFVFPDYDQAVLPPHIAYLILGGFLAIRCILLSYDVSYDAPWTAVDESYPYMARVNTTWAQIASPLPYDYTDAHIGADNQVPNPITNPNFMTRKLGPTPSATAGAAVRLSSGVIRT